MVLQQPTGVPVKGKDIELQEEPKPVQGAGEFLVRMTCMSLDPYMRGTMNEISYGSTLPYPRLMTCGAIGQVVETMHPDFPLGSLVAGQFGWQDYAVSNGKGVRLLPASGGVKSSWYQGVLGMPGATAYYGLLHIGEAKENDVVLVSACAGAVGQLVGQIAKIKGCTAIGMTSTGKVDIAKKFGFDAVIDYTGKSVPDLIKEIKEAAPNGVNVYFDNTGGPCTEAALASLAKYGRVSVCGQIAYYNLEDPTSASAFPGTMTALRKEAKIEGFIVTSLPKAAPGDWTEAQTEMANWLKRGRLKVQEDVSTGLENAFDEFLSFFQGVGDKNNVGKKIVNIAEPPLPIPA